VCFNLQPSKLFDFEKHFINTSTRTLK
jgi:hypothetical protein